MNDKTNNLSENERYVNRTLIGQQVCGHTAISRQQAGREIRTGGYQFLKNSLQIEILYFSV